MRLSLRLYFALLGSLLVFAALAAFAQHRLGGGPTEPAVDKVARLLELVLPASTADLDAQQAAVEKLADALGTDLTLAEADGMPIASVGAPLPVPRGKWRRGDWRHPWGETPVWAVRLDDGRVLVARVPGNTRHPLYAILVTLGVLALAVGVGAYPIVRRMTKRLERLEAGVASLGAGDLSARVPVEGRDEVARLAARFNDAAARIEQLVGAHRTLLANASHELRTPLARIRLALELAGDGIAPARKTDIERDIAELDALIDEVLLTSRLDAVASLDATETFDVLALAAEEGARYGDVAVDGESAEIRGDPRLLRRLLRNLVDNAKRHGAPPVSVHVARRDAQVEIAVDDAGPAIDAAERERIFEPFYRRRGSSSTGAGLGLALVRQIAERHGGRVRCEATAEGKSRFVVTLPIGFDGRCTPGDPIARRR